MMDMMDIQPEKVELPPHETEIHEQDQKEIFYDEQQPTQKEAQKKPQTSIVPITVRQERPEPTPQQLRRRKQMRRRQMEERQANEFLKQPVIKIPNLKKNLKRAYEKNFFDDSKYEYIHTLRKLRKHPQRDSVSSHYGSDESFDIKQHLPKRGFHKRKFAQDDVSSDSDSEKQTRKKKVSKPRQRKPKVKKENLDSDGQPRPPKPRKPRTVSKQFKPTIKVTNTTKPKAETEKIIKDEAKEKIVKPKQLNKDQTSSEEDLQSDSNSQLSSEKVNAQKISKDPPKEVSIPPKIDNQEKKDLPAKHLLEKPAPIPQQIPLKKIVAPNTIIATQPKSNLLPSGIAKRPEIAQKNSTKPLEKQSDSQTSSSESSSSSSQSSSSDSDSSSDNRHKKKKKHTKSKKHRDSSSDSSDHSKRKKRHKKRKHEESSTFKEVKKHRQPKQELKSKIEPQKLLPIQSKTPLNKQQALDKQHTNIVSQTSPALLDASSKEKQVILAQSQRKDAEILNKSIQLPKISQNATQPSQKAFKLQSQSLALTLSHKDVPNLLKTQPVKPNEDVSTGNIIQSNSSISNIIMVPNDQSSQAIITSSSKNNEASSNSHMNIDKEFSKEVELKFDPKVVVLSLVGSSPSSTQVKNTKEKSDMKQKEARKPPHPLPPVKPRTIKIEEFSDEDSQQSYISYLKRARYPREKMVRLRKVIARSESDFDSSSQQGYVERRVIKRVRRPQRVIVDSSSESENRLDYSKKVRVLAKNKNVGQKMSKGGR